MPNTEIYYPKSGRTVQGGNSHTKSYTSPANGEGSIVYLAYHVTYTSNRSAIVSINNVNIAYHFAEIISSQQGLTEYVFRSGMLNPLTPLIFRINYTGGTTDIDRLPSGFPVDKYGNPYLMLAPGDTVTISTQQDGFVCITALDL